MINSNPIHRLILIALPFETCATLIPAEKISSLRERIKCQIFTNERARLACERVKRSLKMKFRVDVTQVVPLLPRKGVDEATVPRAEKAAPSMC